MDVKEIHVGELIEQVFNQQNMTKAEFARRIHTSRQNITSLFKRPDIDVKQLFTISQALNHDFFKYFSTRDDSVIPETDVSIQLKVKSENLEDLFKWISDNGNINISKK